MHIRFLHLQRFRNHREMIFEFDPQLNLICGSNALGKTTILEAIYYLMTGRPLRGSTHQDLIQTGSSFFYLEAVFSKHGVDQKLRIHLKEKEREILHNSTYLRTATNLLKLIQGVVMTPDDVHLIKGSPVLRRQFLDKQISKLDPTYAHVLLRYTKAMQQRNQLLKQKQTATMDSWEEEMAHAAACITLQRNLGIETLQQYSQNFYSYLSDERELLNLEYRSEALSHHRESDIKEFYLKQYQKNRNKEFLLGYTLSGPHIDDMWIGIEKKDARYFASEGQQRCCIAALHMGVWQRLKELNKETPILMIDDVGISLDLQRRTRLLDRLASLGQVFLTTTDEKILDPFNCPKKTFHLPLETAVLSKSSVL